MAQGLHRAQEGGLFVQRLAAVRAEGGGDVEGAVLDKGGARGVPGGVAPGLEGGAQAAGGEAGRIRLALDELLAGKIHDDLAVPHRGDEAVVLFGGEAGHGLEPVGEMGGAVLHGPLLHGHRHRVGHAALQRQVLVDGPAQGFVNVLGQLFPHDAVAKHQTAVQFRHILRHITALLSPFAP